MADIKNLEGMIDSTPIMKDYADIESSKLPEFQIDSTASEIMAILCLSKDLEDLKTRIGKIIVRI